MEAIYIPRLTKAPQQTEVVPFNQAISGLETLTPVEGQVKVTHHGNYLEVSGSAEAIITLTCHRCLQQYNYRLAIAPSELIWLDDAADHIDPLLLDRDIASEDLVETLSPQGYFDPETWIYEQLCLEIPQRQLCDQTCQGIQPVVSEQPQRTIDQRWASLEALRQQFPNQN